MQTPPNPPERKYFIGLACSDILRILIWPPSHYNSMTKAFRIAEIIQVINKISISMSFNVLTYEQ